MKADHKDLVAKIKQLEYAIEWTIDFAYLDDPFKDHLKMLAHSDNVFNYWKNSLQKNKHKI